MLSFIFILILIAISVMWAVNEHREQAEQQYGRALQELERMYHNALISEAMNNIYHEPHLYRTREDIERMTDSIAEAMSFAIYYKTLTSIAFADEENANNRASRMSRDLLTRYRILSRNRLIDTIIERTNIQLEQAA